MPARLKRRARKKAMMTTQLVQDTMVATMLVATHIQARRRPPCPIAGHKTRCLAAWNARRGAAVSDVRGPAHRV